MLTLADFNQTVHYCSNAKKKKNSLKIIAHGFKLFSSLTQRRKHVSFDCFFFLFLFAHVLCAILRFVFRLIKAKLFIQNEFNSKYELEYWAIVYNVKNVFIMWLESSHFAFLSTNGTFGKSFICSRLGKKKKSFKFNLNIVIKIKWASILSLETKKVRSNTFPKSIIYYCLWHRIGVRWNHQWCHC